MQAQGQQLEEDHELRLVKVLSDIHMLVGNLLSAVITQS